MEPVYALVLVVLVAAFVAVPFFRKASPDLGEDPVRAEVEARKEAKYREIRDLELDHAAGKLEPAEYERQRQILREEAIEILRLADRADGDELEAAGEPPPDRPTP